MGPPGRIISFLWERVSNAKWGSENILTKIYHARTHEERGL
nr:MAG TPA: hypothetical protein [Caudoviricetes sp.]